jgi:predicted membrane-bound spermidine synthase
MRPPRWKVFLSYLYEIPVEFVGSSVHQSLSVTLSKGRYQLSTPNAIYSYGDLYENFVRVFERIDWRRVPGDQVLLLGLGLGSIPYMLERKFNKSLQYTAVEIDAHVIRLAHKYVIAELKSQVTVWQADAADFVSGSHQQWDLICVDIFVDDVIPAPVLSPDFLADVKSCLTEGGLLLYNCLARSAKDIEATSNFLDNAFLKVFPDGGILDVGGNWILASDKDFF